MLAMAGGPWEDSVRRSREARPRGRRSETKERCRKGDGRWEASQGVGVRGGHMGNMLPESKCERLPPGESPEAGMS